MKRPLWATRAAKPTAADLELFADSLKERIYGGLALLAVMLSLDSAHTDSLHAAVAVGGTAISLWLASLLSSQMAQRVVFGRPDIEQLKKDRQRHAPLLVSAILPLVLIGLSSLHFLSLQRALATSMWTILLALIFWSAISARAMHASRLATIVLAAFSLLIGVGVVALKAILH